MTKLKFATDCSGVGAPEEAVKELGIDVEHVFACERDKYARMTFLANHHPNLMYDDMENRDTSMVPQLDIYVAGYPCQAFSGAGKRAGEDDVRGTVFYHGLKFMRENRPRAFILENVPGMLNVNGVNMLEKWLDLLAKTVNGQSRMFMNADSLGYSCYWAVLNSMDYGVPQNRERVFIIGLRDDADTFRFPKAEPLTKRLKDVLEPVVDEKYYLSDKMLSWLEKHSDKNKLKGHGFNFKPITGDDIAKTVNARYYKMGVDDNFLLENPDGVDFKILGYNRDRETGKVLNRTIRENALTLHTATGSGGNTDQFVLEQKIIAQRGRYDQYGETEQQFEVNGSEGIAHNALTTVAKDNLVLENLFVDASKIDLNQVGTLYENNADAGRIYDSSGVARTIKAEGGGLGSKTGLYLYNSRIRRLTPRECFRLQDFPDSFIINKVSETQAYKQAGNSMTRRVVKEVIKNVLQGFFKP